MSYSNKISSPFEEIYINRINFNLLNTATDTFPLFTSDINKGESMIIYACHYFRTIGGSTTFQSRIGRAGSLSLFSSTTTETPTVQRFTVIRAGHSVSIPPNTTVLYSNAYQSTLKFTGIVDVCVRVMYFGTQ